MYQDLVRFETRLQAALDTADLAERRMALEECLFDLRTASIDVRTHTGDAIAAARAHGVAWTRIGGALGVTGQAAQQKWGSKKAEPMDEGPGLFG